MPSGDDILAVQDSETFINSALQLQQEHKEPTMRIYYDERLVGVAGHNDLAHNHKLGLIDYCLHQDDKDQEIMTRANKALISHGFTYYQFHQIHIRTVANNQSSSRIPEHLGFQFEGRWRQEEWLYGDYVHHCVYGLLKEEWQE